MHLIDLFISKYSRRRFLGPSSIGHLAFGAERFELRFHKVDSAVVNHGSAPDSRVTVGNYCDLVSIDLPVYRHIC